ncbi:pyridoxine biosynthesis protein [Penicillium ochrochloron]
MAARLPVIQVPAMFARRQPKVLRASRRLQSSSAPQTQNPAYPLYPSVIQLLHEKNIPESEVSKIPASGPKGRLLKGDVLAYLGKIAAEYPTNQAATLAKLMHLDLSNIKIAAPAPKPAAPAAEKKEVIAQPPPMSSIAISISLSAVLSAQKKIQESLGVTVPLSRFLAIATDLANDALPRSKGEQPSSDELFDELLGAEPVNTSRGDYIPELNAFEASEARQPEPVVEDIIDFLSAKPGKKTVASSVSGVEAGAAQNVFSLTVPVGEELRAKTFLERIKTLLQVEPARLVL